MARGFNYGQLMRKALHHFVADVLSQVAREGLPGNHHFFITFDTTHPGVDMDPALKARYPEQMTVVLQEWFTDLAVMKDRFTVTLNFGNVPEPIVIPFEAIETFIDPSVEFGLRFRPQDDDSDENGGSFGATMPLTPAGRAEEKKPAAAEEKEGEVVSLDTFRKR